MAEKKSKEEQNFEAHEKDWKKWCEEYKQLAKIGDPDGFFQYRAKSIEGMMTGNTYGAKKSD